MTTHGIRFLAWLPLLTATLASAEPRTDTVVSSAQPAGVIDVSLMNEVRASIDRGLDWLAANQKEDGSWSNGDFPALTALPAMAFIRSEHPRRADVLAKARSYLLSCVQPDGGIYKVVANRKGGGLGNYNTAICVATLHALRDPSLNPVILKARRFIEKAQHFGQDVSDGGFGYDQDTQRAYTDLLNTYYSVQAMKLTADVEDQRPAGEARADIDWKAVIEFVEKMHNTAVAGEADAGGFFYKPGESKAGTSTNAQGVVVFRSFGTMTYAGAMALLYADVPADDPRVRSALDWTARHWSLSENPGMGSKGLYFFYDILCKTLAAARKDLVPRPDGTFVNWRPELAQKLVSLQRIDPKTGFGYWTNDDNTYWENDPVLVTAYTLVALERL